MRPVTSEASRSDSHAPAWSVADSVAVTALIVAGTLLRAMRLTVPRDPVFDERLYAAEACFYLGDPSAYCFDRELLTEHPPLGKWFVAWGIEIFGNGPLGWRIAAVVAGSLMIPVVYLLARRLLRSTFAASIAAGLLAIDFLHLVHSRIGMIEIFATLFGTTALLCVVVDRDEIVRQGPRGARGWWRPWRVVAGILGGLAVSCKWTGLFYLVAGTILTIAWEMSARKKEIGSKLLDRTLRDEGSSILLAFGLVPLMVYAAAHIGRIDGTLLAFPWESGAWFRELWDRQFAAYEFHRYLVTSNIYQSPPWSWMLVKRPIVYAFDDRGGSIATVVAAGSPLVWWTAAVALTSVAVTWVRTRDFRRPEGLILIGFTVTYPIWFALSLGRQRVFLYYMLASVPFMCLALAHAARSLCRSRRGKGAVATFAAGAVALFVAVYPLLTYQPLSRDGWRVRMWIYDDCAFRPAERLTDGVDRIVESRGPVVAVEQLRRALGGWCAM